MVSKNVISALNLLFKSIVTQMSSLIMEVVHNRIKCYNVESGYPPAVCMVAEDTQFQPMVTNNSVIYTGWEYS